MKLVTTSRVVSRDVVQNAMIFTDQLRFSHKLGSSLTQKRPCTSVISKIGKAYKTRNSPITVKKSKKIIVRIERYLKMKSFFFSVFALCCLATLNAQLDPPETVDEFDVIKYVGRWYQVCAWVLRLWRHHHESRVRTRSNFRRMLTSSYKSDRTLMTHCASLLIVRPFYFHPVAGAHLCEVINSFQTLLARTTQSRCWTDSAWSIQIRNCASSTTSVEWLTSRMLWDSLSSSSRRWEARATVSIHHKI